MRMGQPALLYLVPCTLGTICYLGWRRKELYSLWEGPKVFETADKIMSGGRRSSSHHQMHDNHSNMQQPTAHVDDGINKDEVEEDGDEGDVPLITTNPNGGGIQ